VADSSSAGKLLKANSLLEEAPVRTPKRTPILPGQKLSIQTAVPTACRTNYQSCLAFFSTQLAMFSRERWRNRLPPNRSGCLKWRHQCHERRTLKGAGNASGIAGFVVRLPRLFRKAPRGELQWPWLWIVRKLVEVTELTKLCPKIGHSHCGHPHSHLGHAGNLS